MKTKRNVILKNTNKLLVVLLVIMYMNKKKYTMHCVIIIGKLSRFNIPSIHTRRR